MTEEAVVVATATGTGADSAETTGKGSSLHLSILRFVDTESSIESFSPYQVSSSVLDPKLFLLYPYLSDFTVNFGS